MTRSEDMDAVERRLSELGQLPNDWGGSKKPSERAFTVTRSLIRSMEQFGHHVLRIAPMADGGLSVRYSEGPRSARFDVYNEGGVVVVTRDGHQAPTQYMEMSTNDAVRLLSSFLRTEDIVSLAHRQWKSSFRARVQMMEKLLGDTPNDNVPTPRGIGDDEANDD